MYKHISSSTAVDSSPLCRRPWAVARRLGLAAAVDTAVETAADTAADTVAGTTEPPLHNYCVNLSAPAQHQTSCPYNSSTAVSSLACLVQCTSWQSSVEWFLGSSRNTSSDEGRRTEGRDKEQ